jgi:16S rRNA (guanine966-N2)-methyltransferase
MRLVGGNLSGRNFEAVPGHRTHPMSEKIRGAIFNALGDIHGLTVLDPYSGTGALSFEALSRGAVSATALDTSKEAARTIRENAELLGLTDKMSMSRIFAKAWSRRNQSKLFDIVLLDPPYDAVEPKELLQLSKHAKKGGLIILSLPTHEGFRYGESRQELLSHKNYGDASVFFYRQL